MRKPKQFLSGVCGNCKKETPYAHKDHRVPKRLGGWDEADNIQLLCVECHTRKSAIEVSLFSFFKDTQDLVEWFGLAFQGDRGLAIEFVDHVLLKAHHFREIFNKLHPTQPALPETDPSLRDYLKAAIGPVTVLPVTDAAFGVVQAERKK